MLLNKIKKITGVIRLKILVPDFDCSEKFIPDYVYSGGICLEQTNGKFVSTNYIPGVIDAEFCTYKEIGQNTITYEILEKINWSNAHKLRLSNMSKQWDYINFSLDINIDSCKPDFISFPKINKISGVFSSKKTYSLYGSINKKFKITDNIKTNLIHDLLPSQVFYLGEEIDSYSGSLVYTVCENSGSFYLEIFGITSNNYDGYSRIIPIKYLEYSDFIVNTNSISWTPELNDLVEIPIIKVTQYPQFNKNFGSIIKKDDIVVMINQQNIINMEIYNYQMDLKMSLDEWLTYSFQMQHQSLTQIDYSLTLIRKGKIIELMVDINIFKMDLINPIYLDINDLYTIKNEIKFSSDICDLMLQNKIYDQKLVKYMNDITYQIDKICL